MRFIQMKNPSRNYCSCSEPLTSFMLISKGSNKLFCLILITEKCLKNFTSYHIVQWMFLFWNIVVGAQIFPRPHWKMSPCADLTMSAPNIFSDNYEGLFKNDQHTLNLRIHITKIISIVQKMDQLTLSSEANKIKASSILVLSLAETSIEHIISGMYSTTDSRSSTSTSRSDCRSHLFPEINGIVKSTQYILTNWTE